MARLKVGSTRAARRAGAVVGGPDSWHLNLAYPKLQTNPSSSSVCDPPLRALAPESQLLSDQARGQPANSPKTLLYIGPWAARFVNGFGSGC
ncbi:hypothetical protein PGTUg99_015354 [Puccinia graminis f. sp. tritici]|uniref:Uncharacterized protein n=1 Tax=Puccinia graminis f. sp. tritici TaxID=56615 RepID=A0A5B0R047_PUCGR|nr:hypothetical protein PGTUg99_015354 [Puccinia graminis f. sp. tritici]